MSSRSSGFLSNIIPTTIVGAFASGDILQVLFFSVLFGISLALVDKGKPVVSFLQDLVAPVFKLVAILMKAAPVGAFGAMAFTIGKYGIGSIANLAMLIGTFYITALLFVLVVVLGAVARYNGFSILALIRYIKEELLLVLGTSSSEAALPTLMDKMEKAGCKRSVVGMVIPTGYSFNLDGTNIYMTLAALFIAQATDIPLSLGDQIALLLVVMLKLQGRGGHHRCRLHHPGRDALGGAGGAGGGHGADPRHRPLHVRVPRADQPGRQRGGDHRRRPLGRRAGQAAARRRPRAGRAPRRRRLPSCRRRPDRPRYPRRPARPGVVPFGPATAALSPARRLGLESPLLPHLRRTREPAEAAAIPPDHPAPPPTDIHRVCLGRAARSPYA
ncbi:C4-dicarboxylate transport protein [Stutzerimonas stutzeri]